MKCMRSRWPGSCGRTAIEKAEDGDFELVKLLEKTLSNPYIEHKEAEEQGFSGKVPDWSKDLVVSCSS